MALPYRSVMTGIQKMLIKPQCFDETQAFRPDRGPD
jgi:hypothetical protein